MSVVAGATQRLDGRERRKRATRRALRAATLELGLERGLADVPVEEIAERAGVSTRTFFNYFETKEDAALIELFTVSDDKLTVFATGPPDVGVWADLTLLFAADVERAEEEGPDLPRYMALHDAHPALQARQLGRFTLFATRLAEAIQVRLGGAPSTRLRADVMSGSCITAVRVGLQHWAATRWHGAARVHVDAAFAEFDKAFRT